MRPKDVCHLIQVKELLKYRMETVGEKYDSSRNIKEREGKKIQKIFKKFLNNSQLLSMEQQDLR
jgi:hypothetical protein